MNSQQLLKEDKLRVSFQDAEFLDTDVESQATLKILTKNRRTYTLQISGANSKILVARNGIIVHPVAEAGKQAVPSLHEAIEPTVIDLQGGEMIYVESAANRDEGENGIPFKIPSFEQIAEISRLITSGSNVLEVLLLDIMERELVALDAVVFITESDNVAAVSRLDQVKEHPVDDLTEEEWALIARDLEEVERNRVLDEDNGDRDKRRKEKVAKRSSHKDEDQFTLEEINEMIAAQEAQLNQAVEQNEEKEEMERQPKAKEEAEEKKTELTPEQVRDARIRFYSSKTN